MVSKVLSQRERRNLSEPQYINWKTKICECCDDDCGMFVFGVLCANTSIPQLYERIVKKCRCLIFTLLLWTSFVLSLTIPLYLGTRLNIWGLIWGISSLVLFILLSSFLVFMVRTKLRKKNNISGNSLDDCCTSFWCCTCSHMQHMREEELTIENYKLNSVNAV